MSIKTDKFRLYFDRLAWSALTGIAWYSATLLKEVSDSVHTMNTNLAVLSEKVSSHDLRLNDVDATFLRFDERIKKVELSSASRARRIQVYSVSE